MNCAIVFDRNGRLRDPKQAKLCCWGRPFNCIFVAVLDFLVIGCAAYLNLASERALEDSRGQRDREGKRHQCDYNPSPAHQMC